MPDQSLPAARVDSPAEIRGLWHDLRAALLSLEADHSEGRGQAIADALDLAVALGDAIEGFLDHSSVELSEAMSPETAGAMAEMMVATAGRAPFDVGEELGTALRESLDARAEELDAYLPPPGPPASPESHVARVVRRARAAHEIAELRRGELGGPLSPTIDEPPSPASVPGPVGPVAPAAGPIAPPSYVMPPQALCLAPVLAGDGSPLCSLLHGHPGVHESRG